LGSRNIDPPEAAAARTLPPVERTDYQDSITENEESKINEIKVYRIFFSKYLFFSP